MRFQQRLAAQKITERRRRLWGVFVLTFGGIGLLGWITAPFVFAFIASPVEWITATLGYFLFAINSLQVLREITTVLFRIMPDFISPYAWMVLASALAGFGLLWIISIWRFARTPRGVSV
jgi:hypothetical protein